MPNVAVYDMAGKKTGDLALSEAVFGIKPNKVAMHTAVVNYLANQRQGTQSALTRAEVRGGGKKPWRQKGTGHARQGSIRAPQWTHGGVALGPKPRDYRYTINRKVRKLAMLSALSSKVEGSDFIVLDTLELSEIKTKSMIAILGALGVSGKALVVTMTPDLNVIKSASNIPGIKTTLVNTLSVYDILNYDKFVIVKDCVAKLEEVYA